VYTMRRSRTKVANGGNVSDRPSGYYSTIHGNWVWWYLPDPYTLPVHGLWCGCRTGWAEFDGGLKILKSRV